MSVRLSNEITECVRAGRYVLSALEIEGPRVAASFMDDAEPHLEAADEEPRPGALLVAVGRKLRAALDYLVVTDSRVAEAAGWESTLRQLHKADKRQLGFFIVALRRLVIAQYVEPDLDNLGLQPLNVRDAMTVLRRAELIGERFVAPNLSKMLGKSRFEAPADLSGPIGEVQAKAAKLLVLSGEIDEAHRTTDRARIERKAARADYDRVYLRGARMFEDMCRFAGLDELAARVRRSASRPAAVKEMVDEEVVLEEPLSEEMVDEEMVDELKDRSGQAEALPLAEIGLVDVQTVDVQVPCTPKGLYPSAQGKRSATLGRRETPL